MAVTDNTDDTGTAQIAIIHLTHLTERLREHGLRVRVASRRPPKLAVDNPDAPALSENVHAAPEEGTWWFWWSWNEKIAPVAEADDAARRIRHVLTPAVRSR
ncbi:hypothetical protein OHA77_15955 [Streptosporangium sp. NBC_01639]|uniref:hypothetical protein n=1 Tax=Streptosporangium sp. NBC_01639 TaxID=2975948 RepID=UPI003863BC2A|nr:hypothetical protein OHA77_15955 [Streptosporangium sp. NBC_01639]